MEEAIRLNSDNADKILVRRRSMKRIALSAALLVVGSAPAAFADAERLLSPFRLASSPATQNKFWVKVTRRSSLKDIADDLHIPASDLIALNEKLSHEKFETGTWIILPTNAHVNLAVATLVSKTEVLYKAPLSTFTQDQAVSLSELRSLATPKAMPRPPRPLLPISLAELRVKPPRRFDRSLDSLERNQIITPQQRRTLERGAVAQPITVSRFQQACRSGALSKRECTKENDGIAIFPGGSLSAFSRKHNVSLSELRSLNPGLDLARLVEGMEVRIAQSSSYLKALQQKSERIKRDQERYRREHAARASALKAKAERERERAENERMEREALSRINRAKQTIQNSF